MAQRQDHLLVAAIDFGTTYSGYAFSTKDAFKTDPLKIYANQAWNAGGRQLLSLKTPTCILLNPDKQFDSFGYEAENKYADLVMEEEHEDYYYFHRFKMSLHNNKNVKEDMMLEDITGKAVKAIDVFALSIEALKNHLIAALETQGTGVKPSEIRWVLTVPAIWTDNAKQFMRKSAEMAGIPKNCLLISLEPEAASIYCQYLPTEKLSGIESGFTMSNVGTKYMVVDIGGGTADITIHEKLVGDNLKEICRASGGDCGGTSVDTAFIQMLVKIFGAPLINSMKQEEPAAYLDLLREFETVKRTVTSSKSGKINMAIPYATLDSLCSKHLKKDLLSSLSSSPYAQSIIMRRDKMRIEADLFKSVFEKTIQSLIQLVKDALEQEKARSVDQVLLVGGFSECSLIQEAIKKTFNTCRVVVPKECGLAVLQGAVLFGHKPSFIASRISRFTYGIGVSHLFDADLHDEKYKTIINGEERCQDLFDVIMEKDAHVPAGTVVKKSYISNINHNSITFRIFVSENSCPMYVLEDGCTKLGSVSVKITNSSIEHKCDVELVFGNTELSIVAKETDSSCVFEANFDLI
ncbi:heat shock 70 kDa protein 12A-like [Mytilus galloprovincialis]|uniref:heat shock 70 kDa protein 12A-like n=1 Tax=Mytilus galloprovincialis TaxID=29158 RepID=UPI003F7CA960